MAHASVLLVDDHALIRQGCRAILAQRDDLTVVGEADNAEEALTLVAQLRPRVVVMDVNLPGTSGIEATRQMKAQDPRLQVIILSAYPDEAYIHHALEAGASAYILKQGAARELGEAIDAVLAGHHYLSPVIAGTLVQAYLQPQGHAPVSTAPGLTAKEREVLLMLTQGLSSKEIGHRLNSSARTIEVHRRNMMKKLRLHSFADLIKYAIRHKIAAVDE